METLKIIIVSISMLFLVQKFIINHTWWTPIIAFGLAMLILQPFEIIDEDTYQPDLTQPYIIP